MAKYRVGVIGCGGMARGHVQGYLNSGRFEVVALADLAEERMAGYDERFGFTTTHYTDARKMLDNEGLDVVSVGVRHGGHATWTIAAAARKPKAILCEKPMAIDIGSAEQMLIACQRNDVKLAIGHQRRFLPAYTMARNLIAEGAIGDVLFMRSYGHDGLPNYCSHQSDMFRYLLGDEDCEWVMGNVERKTDRWERNTRIEDKALAVFGFPSGAQAMILLDVVPIVYQGAHVFGTKGMIDFTTEELRLLNKSTGGDWKVYRPDGKFFKADDTRFEWVEGGAGQADEIADWIEGKVENHRNCGENGYKALEMLHAVYESARCHEKVVLPLQTRVNPLDWMIDNDLLPVERPGPYEIRARGLAGELMSEDGSDS